MAKEENPRVEDLSQLVKRIKDEHGVSDSEIARRIGVAPATVNAWVHRKRGTGRGPNPDTLRALAHAYGEPEHVVFAAAGRKGPGPLSPEAEERIQQLYRGLTAEQQRMLETQMRALVNENRSNA